MSSGAAGYSTESGRHAGTTLTDAIRMWPTPNAPSGGRSPNEEEVLTGRAMNGGKRQVHLESLVRFWPTPDANAVNDGESPESWLRRREINKAKGYNGNGQGTPLGMATVMWPTPAATADDHSRGGDPERYRGSKSQNGRRSNLIDAVAGRPPSLQAREQETSGRPSSPTAQTSRPRLNPAFAEWLMGWPIGWSDCGSPVTEWSLWLQQSHSWLSLLVRD